MARYRDFWAIRFGEIDGKPSDYRLEKVRGLPTRLLCAPEWACNYLFFAYKDIQGWHVIDVESGGAVTKNCSSLSGAHRIAITKLQSVTEKEFLEARQKAIELYGAQEIRNR